MADRAGVWTTIATAIADWFEDHPAVSATVRTGSVAIGTLLLIPASGLARILGGLAFALGVVFEALATWRVKKRNDERVKSFADAEAQWSELEAGLNVAMNDALRPVAEMVAGMAPMSPGKRRHHRDKVADHVAGAGALLRQDVRRLRVVVYVVAPVRAGRRVLNPLAWHGRADKPSPFVDTDQAGARVFELLESGASDFVEDVGAAPPTKWVGMPGDYQTCITVPVIANGYAYALMTVDAPAVGDLTGNDVATYEVLAALLAIAFAWCDSTVGQQHPSRRKSSGPPRVAGHPPHVPSDG